MILAITYNPDNKEILKDFGESGFFKLYNIERNEIIDSSVASTDGHEHCALAGVLRRIGVNALVCCSIEEEAVIALAELGIRVINGVTGSSDDAARKFAQGTLVCHENEACLS